MSAVDKAGAAKEKGDQMVAKLSEGDKLGTELPEPVQRYCPMCGICCIWITIILIMSSLVMYRIDGKIYNYDFYSEEYMDEGKLKVGRQSEQTSDYNDDYEKFYNRFNLFFYLAYLPLLFSVVATLARAVELVYVLIKSIPLAGDYFGGMISSKLCRLCSLCCLASIFVLSLLFFSLFHTGACENDSDPNTEIDLCRDALGDSFFGSKNEENWEASWGPSTGFFVLLMMVSCCIPCMCIADLKTEFGGSTPDEVEAPAAAAPAAKA
eukprot:TRINITY_DN16877_c0_g1_i1.p1 TRINITY_DN16877_c0_g1~~TRINITY_DN16877_c0_g1_i1.p1  ORF type:complete len:266 (-),score=62.62 TRINITY_DN16877_c0_g1_i1:195-992(-)